MGPWIAGFLTVRPLRLSTLTIGPLALWARKIVAQFLQSRAPVDHWAKRITQCPPTNGRPTRREQDLDYRSKKFYRKKMKNLPELITDKLSWIFKTGLSLKRAKNSSPDEKHLFSLAKKETWINLWTVDLSCMRTIKLRGYYSSLRTHQAFRVFNLFPRSQTQSF